MNFYYQITRTLKLVPTILNILNYLSVQRSFLSKNIEPILSGARKGNDGNLDETDFTKINKYYGLAVPAILGEAFCVLHDKKMSFVERWTATAQGAMTGLFDDFFDKACLSDDAIAKMLHENVPEIKKSNEKFFDFFYMKALRGAPDKKKMQQALMEVYNAQVESKKQAEQTLTEEEIKNISFLKGGTSLLFYRSAFLPLASIEEEKLLYHLGGIMQLANDIFDVYKDRNQNIKTLVTTTNHISPIRRLLEQKLGACYKEAYNMSFPKKNITGFLSIISIGIFSRAFVCLDQLEKNESATNNEFAVHQYSRKQLICDMDKKRNMLRSAAYHISGIKF